MFLMYLNILFFYYVLLPLILTIVTCMYYYCILQAMYGPSLINYCLLSIVYLSDIPVNTIITFIQRRPSADPTLYKCFYKYLVFTRIYVARMSRRRMSRVGVVT